MYTYGTFKRVNFVVDDDDGVKVLTESF